MTVLKYLYKMLDLLECRIETYPTHSAAYYDDLIRIRECRDKIKMETYNAVNLQQNNTQPS